MRVQLCPLRHPLQAVEHFVLVAICLADRQPLMVEIESGIDLDAHTERANDLVLVVLRCLLVEVIAPERAKGGTSENGDLQIGFKIRQADR